MNFSMSKPLFKKTKKANTATLQFSDYEKAMIFARLGRAVEKLKEAREEIRQAIKVIIGMKYAGDDLADQALLAVAELYPREDNPWILSVTPKKPVKKETPKAFYC